MTWVSSTGRSQSSRHPSRSRRGHSHELLRAGATVIGCSRSELDGVPAREPDRVDGSLTRWFATKAISAPSAPYLEDGRRLRAHATSWSTTPAAPCPRPAPRTSPNWSSGSRALPAPTTTSSGRCCLLVAVADEPDPPRRGSPSAYRQMLGQDGVGWIVNISSGTGHPAGSPTGFLYGAAKAGLNHLTRSLAGVGPRCWREQPGARSRR